jgi:hypothetical protein
MKRPVPASFAVCGLLLLLAAAPARATKLDLFSDVEVKAGNYTHLVYGSGGASQPLFNEDAELGFVIKDIKLEKAPDSTMDVGIVLQSVGTGASTATVTAPQFADAINRLPAADGTPFVRDAYVKIYKFLRPNVTATFGRQDFALGQGITLGSDDIGMPGGLIEADNVYKNLRTDLFVFRPFLTDRYYKIYGGSAYLPGQDGLWQLYHFWQEDQGPSQDLGFSADSRIKKFTGLRYVMNKNQLSFDGEAAIERGKATLQGGGTGSYAGHAFMLKGSWTQHISFFGESRLRLAYGSSSGNTGTGSDTDKAFFPDFGSRYSGMERAGMGAIAGASLYDIIKTSSTANGLPYGVSGLNIIDIGADLPYKKCVLSADLYKYRAVANANNGSLQIASEYDFKLAYPLSDNLRLNVVYAVFTPLGLYPSGKPAKLIYTSASARF